MRDRWANAIKSVRRFRLAVRNKVPVTSPAVDREIQAIEAGLDVLSALESLPVDACEYLYLKMRTKNALRYYAWGQQAAAAYEVEMTFRRIRSIAGGWTCHD